MPVATLCILQHSTLCNTISLAKLCCSENFHVRQCVSCWIGRVVYSVGLSPTSKEEYTCRYKFALKGLGPFLLISQHATFLLHFSLNMAPCHSIFVNMPHAYYFVNMPHAYSFVNIPSAYSFPNISPSHAFPYLFLSSLQSSLSVFMTGAVYCVTIEAHLKFNNFRNDKVCDI